MCPELRVRAYAKVNFGLNVLPKKSPEDPDYEPQYEGFHKLESIFQTVSLYDELIVRKQVEKVCSILCDSISLPEENTLTMAFKAFCDVTGKNDFGVHVELLKGIPSGGGLGGGSSDGAALIKALEKFYGVRLNKDQLSQIASKIGSDVFFFTRCNEEGSGCALVSGRGEVVQEIEGRKDLYLLMVFPKTSSSTKLAYSLIDKMHERGESLDAPVFEDYEKIYRDSPEKWTFVNTFTPVISSEYEEIDRALKSVRKTGALYSEVSGSGSTVYGIFTSEQQAEHAKSLLVDEMWSCKVCKTL